jgi:hypothetical protein
MTKPELPMRLACSLITALVVLNSVLRAQAQYVQNFDSPAGANGQVVYRASSIYLADGASPSGGDKLGNSFTNNSFIVPNTAAVEMVAGINYGNINQDQSGAGYFLYEGTENTAQPRPLYSGTLWRVFDPVPVTNGATYVFSFYLTNVGTLNPAQVRPFINDAAIGDAVSASGNFDDGIAGHQWQRFTFVWTADAATADIRLDNLRTVGAGNDFAVDTISLAPASADFDGNLRVDGNDFLRWQRGLGLTGADLHSQGDADGDGRVDGTDLAVWRSQFGHAPSVFSVPEPSGLALAVGVLCALARFNGTAPSRSTILANWRL